MPLKEIIISPDNAGKRVCDYVREILSGIPESVIRRIFSSRDVKLDGIRVSGNDTVHEGQTLKIYIPDNARMLSRPLPVIVWTTAPAAFVFLPGILRRWKSCRMFSAAVR